MYNDASSSKYKDMGVTLQLVCRVVITLYLNSPTETIAEILVVAVTGTAVVHQDSTRYSVLIITVVGIGSKLYQWQQTMSLLQHGKLMADKAALKQRELLIHAELGHQTVVYDAFMTRTKAELLELKVNRLKLQLLTATSSAISEGPSAVIRQAREREAWTERWLVPNLKTDDDSRNAKIPCLAVSTPDGICFTAHMLRGASLGKEMKLKPGSHAFVKLADEDCIRVNVMACEFGEASGHPKLANEQPVLYAGV